MIRDLLNDVPPWLLALLIFGVAESIVLISIGVRTGRRKATRHGRTPAVIVEPLTRHVERKEGLTLLFSFVTATYGVFLAFVVVSLWTDLQAASADLNSEASQLAIVSRLGESLPEPNGPVLVQQARDYASWVRRVDFPLMARGKQPAPPPELQQMYQTLAAVTPKTAEQEHFSEVATQALAQLTIDMRSRDWRSEDSMPYELQLLLFGGAAVVVELATLLDYENLRLHLAVTSTIAAVLSFLVFLTMSLEYPYSGGISARADSLRQGVLAAPDRPARVQSASRNWGPARTSLSWSDDAIAE